MNNVLVSVLNGVSKISFIIFFQHLPNLKKLTAFSSCHPPPAPSPPPGLDDFQQTS